MERVEETVSKSQSTHFLHHPENHVSDLLSLFLGIKFQLQPVLGQSSNQYQQQVFREKLLTLVQLVDDWEDHFRNQTDFSVGRIVKKG